MELIGTWTLEAMEVFDDTGVIARPYGDAPIGQISYRTDGTMSAVLCPAERPNLGSLGGATDAQWAAAARWFAGYCGTWERDGDTVRHHVAAAHIPDWIGTTLVRRIGERDGCLTLTVDPRAPGKPSQRLVWAPVTPPEN
jgi:hypothetical protein